MADRPQITDPHSGVRRQGGAATIDNPGNDFGNVVPQRISPIDIDNRADLRQVNDFALRSEMQNIQNITTGIQGAVETYKRFREVSDYHDSQAKLAEMSAELSKAHTDIEREGRVNGWGRTQIEDAYEQARTEVVGKFTPGFERYTQEVRQRADSYMKQILASDEESFYGRVAMPLLVERNAKLFTDKLATEVNAASASGNFDEFSAAIGRAREAINTDEFIATDGATYKGVNLAIEEAIVNYIVQQGEKGASAVVGTDPTTGKPIVQGMQRSVEIINAQNEWLQQNLSPDSIALLQKELEERQEHHQKAANERATAEEKQRKKGMSDYLARFELAVNDPEFAAANGLPPATRDTVREDLMAGRIDLQTANKAYNKIEKKTEVDEVKLRQTAWVDGVIEGTEDPDVLDPNYRKGVENWWKENSAGILSQRPDVAAETVYDNVRSLEYVPPQLLGDLNKLMSNEETAQWGALVLSTMYGHKDLASQIDKSGRISQRNKDMADYISLGYSYNQAKKMSETTPSQEEVAVRREQLNARNKDYKEGRESRYEEFQDRAESKWSRAGFSVPEVPAHIDEYRETRYKKHFLRTGDSALAAEQAARDTDHMFGVSDINGEEEWMPMAPFGYGYEEFKAEVNTEGFYKTLEGNQQNRIRIKLGNGEEIEPGVDVRVEYIPGLTGKTNVPEYQVLLRNDDGEWEYAISEVVLPDGSISLQRQTLVLSPDELIERDLEQRRDEVIRKREERMAREREVGPYPWPEGSRITIGGGN